VTTTKTAPVRDPLGLPQSITELPWYVELLEVLAATERDQAELTDRKARLEAAIEKRRHAGRPVTPEERSTFRELTNGIRGHDRLIREHKKVLRAALVEHHAEVDRILNAEIAAVVAEAKAVNGELSGRLGDAVTAYNQALAAKQIIHSQFLQPRSTMLPGGVSVPSEPPAPVASALELVARIAAGE
jgi:hypothetical protein